MHRDLFARLGAAALLLLGVAARGQSELYLFEGMRQGMVSNRA